MQGDAASLHRLAVILLDNAIKYAGTGSGTGLGLAIAQSICQAHHAAIRAESGQDGTTFRVEIRKEQGEHHGN